MTHQRPADERPAHKRSLQQSPTQAASRIARRLLIGLVQVYRLLVSPVMAPSCRYWPTCSEYAIEALRGHGAVRGSWLTAKRLCRCHPWSAGGVDDVPPAGLSNNRWRAYMGDSRRDPSDSPSQ